MMRLGFTSALVLLGLAATSAQCGPYRFITIDSTLGPSTQILGLNDSGVASGYHVDPVSGLATGLIFSGGKEQQILAPNAVDTEFYQINNAGQIATSFYRSDFAYHAAVYNSGSGVWNFLPDVPGYAYNLAGGINNKGLVIGNVYNDTTNFTDGIGWAWDGSKYAFFSAPGADTTQGGTVTYSVNDSGQVVGVYYDGNGMGHGYLKTGSNFQVIDFPGASETDLYGINDAGVVGGRYLLNGFAHAFLWSNGVFTPIDIPGEETRGVAAVNNVGEIAGWYRDPQGNIHAFEGTPFPEPGTLFLFGAGGLGLLGMGLRKLRKARQSRS